MDELTYDILRTAVNLGRNEQIGRLTELRARLDGLYPGEPARIDDALRYWADYEVESAQRNGDRVQRPRG